jgi:hypothetical protein
LIGDDASLPIQPADGTIVFDSVAASKKAWTWDIRRVGESGHLMAAYAVFESTTDHRYYVARWSGTSWTSQEVCEAGDSLIPAEEPFYSGGIAIVDENTVVVSRQVSGQHEIWKYEYNGSAWVGEAITTASIVPNFRPVVPRILTAPNTAPRECVYLSGAYSDFTAFSTEIKYTQID